MADFLQALDPSKLVLVDTALSFLVSPFAAPPYNLAIFLFGTYAQEATDAVQSLQTFTALVGVSVIFDIVWMIRNDQSGFVRMFTIILLVLKIPTFFVFGNALRQRGGQFSQLGIRGNDLTGPVWSIPGGFPSNPGDSYQSIDEESPPRPHKKPQPGVTAPPSVDRADRVPSSGTPVAYQTA